MERTSKHKKILQDYGKVKKEHLKYLKKKVVEIEENISIVRSKQFNFNLFKIFK